MLFDGRLVQDRPRNLIGLQLQDFPGKEELLTVEGLGTYAGALQRSLMCLRITACTCPPLALRIACPARAADECIHHRETIKVNRDYSFLLYDVLSSYFEYLLLKLTKTTIIFQQHAQCFPTNFSSFCRPCRQKLNCGVPKRQLRFLFPLSE